MYLEGVMLLSGLLNWQTLSADPGNDLPFIVFSRRSPRPRITTRNSHPILQSDFDKALAEARTFCAERICARLAQRPDARERGTSRRSLQNWRASPA